MPTWKHDESGYKLTIRNLRQIDLENFERELQAIERKGLFEEWGAIVRSAYAAKWVEYPETLDVGEADPRLVRWMAAQLDKHYAELNQLPIDPE